jgi:hypothetical protein
MRAFSKARWIKPTNIEFSGILSTMRCACGAQPLIPSRERAANSRSDSDVTVDRISGKFAALSFGGAGSHKRRDRTPPSQDHNVRAFGGRCPILVSHLEHDARWQHAALMRHQRRIGAVITAKFTKIAGVGGPPTNRVENQEKQVSTAWRRV